MLCLLCKVAKKSGLLIPIFSHYIKIFLFYKNESPKCLHPIPSKIPLRKNTRHILRCKKNALPSHVAPNPKELKDCKQKLANMRPEDYDRLLKGDPLRRIQDVYCANPTDTILEILEKSNLSDFLADRAKIFHIS